MAVAVVSSSVREPTATSKLPTTVASVTSSSAPGAPPQVWVSPVARFTAVGWVPVAPTIQSSPNHVTLVAARKPCGVDGVNSPSHVPTESSRCKTVS